jgi:hypothetical protein
MLAPITKPACGRWPAAPLVRTIEPAREVRMRGFDRRERAPVPQLEELPRLVETELGEPPDDQLLTGGEDQMVDATEPLEQCADRGLRAQIDGMARGAISKPRERVVDPRPVARRDDDACPFARCPLGHREADARCAAEDHDVLAVQHGCLLGLTMGLAAS